MMYITFAENVDMKNSVFDSFKKYIIILYMLFYTIQQNTGEKKHILALARSIAITNPGTDF